MYNSIRPGQVWLDTNGKRIQAHGGSVKYIDGIYYWFGENKEFTTGDGKYWTYGIRCYTSKDLYNWEDKGLIIPPSEDENSPLYPKNMIDRPHIVYNEKMKKYVCWLKIMYLDGVQALTILTANDVLGPYTIVREKYRPLNMNAGDFDLVIAPDGKGYYYFERVHSEMICADLTEDYTGVTGYYSTHFPSTAPPYVREAPAYFARNGKHYLFTSGTTGYYPNPSEIAVADTYHGPFKVLGDPHIGDESNTSFHSQITSVFKVEGKKELYIAMADRWMPTFAHLPYAPVKKLYELAVAGRKKEAKALMREYGMPDCENTSIADYVWLPITFEGDMPKLIWQNEWKIEDYE